MRHIGGRGDIVFLGRVSDDELRSVFSCARALLFPGVEDFGIVPVEAQAAGVPVIARGEGGALETVVDGDTGLFFGDGSLAALCSAIERFESRTWSADVCRRNSRRFSAGEFERKMKSVLGICS